MVFGGVKLENKEELRESIQKNYAKIAQQGSSGGCCSGGCSCNCGPIDLGAESLRIGYTEDDLLNVPAESNMGLGCGNPVAIAALKEGETVLDLGCGGGLDCFLARKQVGETGYVYGVDMTPEMIKLARQNVQKSGYDNVEFRLGEIEHLPLADSSVDVIISNCVINLSLEKEKVIEEAYRVLKPNGRMVISDVVATAELPDNIKHDLNMMAGCIAGAEYVGNIRSMLKNKGFRDIKLEPEGNSREIIKSWVPGSNAEDYVASYFIKAVK